MPHAPPKIGILHYFSRKFHGISWDSTKCSSPSWFVTSIIWVCGNFLAKMSPNTLIGVESRTLQWLDPILCRYPVNMSVESCVVGYMPFLVVNILFVSIFRPSHPHFSLVSKCRINTTLKGIERPVHHQSSSSYHRRVPPKHTKNTFTHINFPQFVGFTW